MNSEEILAGALKARSAIETADAERMNLLSMVLKPFENGMRPVCRTLGLDLDFKDFRTERASHAYFYIYRADRIEDSFNSSRKTSIEAFRGADERPSDKELREIRQSQLESFLGKVNFFKLEAVAHDDAPGVVEVIVHVRNKESESLHKAMGSFECWKLERKYDPHKQDNTGIFLEAFQDFVARAYTADEIKQRLSKKPAAKAVHA